MLIGGFLAVVPLSGQTGPLPMAQAKPKASEKEARKEAVARLKQVLHAFPIYLGDHKTFPPAAVVTKDGKALLSWRVLLLPYLGEEKLFREFKLTEPWDSPHNSKLLGRMPTVFAPTWGEGIEANCTPWQVFVGRGTIFEGNKGCSLGDITDGTVNTILVAEGGRLVPWTKPEDMPYDAKKAIPQFGFMFPEGFLIGTADAAIHFGKRNYDVPSMRAAITRNGDDYPDFDKIFVKDPQ